MNPSRSVVRRPEATALALSFVLVSVLGCVFLVRYWSSVGHPERGVTRALAFVAIMAAVHVVGYRAYRRQDPSLVLDGEVPVEPKARIAPEYRPAIRVALVQQMVLLILSALMLDGGRALRVCSIAIVAHALAIFLIVWRRPTGPTPLDLALIRFGFCLILIVVAITAPFVSR
jgi:hypothetical protein